MPIPTILQWWANEFTVASQVFMVEEEVIVDSLSRCHSAFAWHKEKEKKNVQFSRLTPEVCVK